MLGLPADATQFDVDIIFCINSVFTILRQLNVGPQNGFSITDASTTWEDYVGDAENLESLQAYMYLKTRMMFDPPTSSFVMTAMKEQAAELEWRLNLEVDPQEVVKRDEIS